MKEIIGKNKLHSNNSSPRLTIKEEDIYNDQEIASNFNNFIVNVCPNFVNVGPNDKNKVLPKAKTPLRHKK